MILQTFLLVADHLIEIMGVGLMGALVMRYLAYKAGNRDQSYFLTFSRGMEKALQSEDRTQQIKDIDGWVAGLLNKIISQLPERSLRNSTVKSPDGANFRFKENSKESFADFADGKKSVSHAIKQQMDVFKSSYMPNFDELTERVLMQDKQWRSVAGVPINLLMRVLDMLPGLFVVGGIMGTFTGIAVGLPLIGKIDLGNIQESAPILTHFIDSIAFSMQCSIAGIFYSLVMTLLNGLFPISTAREDVHKNLSRVLELMWRRIHGEAISTADERIIRLLEGIEFKIGKDQANRKAV
jgi:hypothetical protein